MLFTCSNPGHKHTHAPAADHGQTVTNGKKHFTVDIHCHVHVPEADAMLKDVQAAISMSTPMR